jgi:5-methylcytosine-specific restriction endonuclease McrA
MPKGVYKKTKGIKKPKQSERMKGNKYHFKNALREYQCVVCKNIFKDYQSIKRKVCSKRCEKIYRKIIMKGNKFSLGYIHPLKDRIKNSEVQKLRIINGTHNFWQGGISYEPYSVDWTNTLRRSIRERDKYICRLCKKPQEEIAHDVHHIDYDKKNCDPNNLITLCHNCHIKTNYKRDYWEYYFKKFIEEAKLCSPKTPPTNN